MFQSQLGALSAPCLHKEFSSSLKLWQPLLTPLFLRVPLCCFRRCYPLLRSVWRVLFLVSQRMRWLARGFNFVFLTQLVLLVVSRLVAFFSTYTHTSVVHGAGPSNGVCIAQGRWLLTLLRPASFTPSRSMRSCCQPDRPLVVPVKQNRWLSATLLAMWRSQDVNATTPHQKLVSFRPKSQHIREQIDELCLPLVAHSMSCVCFC